MRVIHVCVHTDVDRTGDAHLYSYLSFQANPPTHHQYPTPPLSTQLNCRGKVLPIYSSDLYISVISSGQELPDLEALHQADPDKPIIFFNLNLETHRGDLGLPAFPSKDLHYRFLSRIKPVYLLRTRQYAQTLSRPPFILNYQVRLYFFLGWWGLVVGKIGNKHKALVHQSCPRSNQPTHNTRSLGCLFGTMHQGALFRTYPGGYQCLLDTGSGRYRRVDTLKGRPPLSGFKEVSCRCPCLLGAVVYVLAVVARLLASRSCSCSFCPAFLPVLSMHPSIYPFIHRLFSRTGDHQRAGGGRQQGPGVPAQGRLQPHVVGEGAGL